jgi:hypothetical protein
MTRNLELYESCIPHMGIKQKSVVKKALQAEGTTDEAGDF